MKTQTHTVAVTEADILAGSPGNSRSCPIAIAADRCIDRPSGFDVQVGLDEIGIVAPIGVRLIGGRFGLHVLHMEDGERDELSVGLPGSAEDFVDYFDGGMSVDPFEFDVDFTKCEKPAE